jgi:hypothetical protein
MSAQVTHGLATMRGPLDFKSLPRGLQDGLIFYDNMRAMHGHEAAAQSTANQQGNLKRINSGLAKITYRGRCAIVCKHSGVDRGYVKGCSSLSTLMGLFWWNDGKGESRRRLLELAWKKGEEK